MWGLEPILRNPRLRNGPDPTKNPQWPASFSPRPACAPLWATTRLLFLTCHASDVAGTSNRPLAKVRFHTAPTPSIFAFLFGLSAPPRREEKSENEEFAGRKNEDDKRKIYLLIVLHTGKCSSGPGGIVRGGVHSGSTPSFARVHRGFRDWGHQPHKGRPSPLEYPTTFDRRTGPPLPVRCHSRLPRTIPVKQVKNENRQA